MSVTLGLFAGPGGWAEGCRGLGVTEAGIELDAAACATRAAAGHHTIRADVAAFPLGQLAGRVTGLIGSPPCTTFSAAGKRAGVAVTDVLGAMVLDAFEGAQTRAAHHREMARMLRLAWWPGKKLTRAQRAAAIWKAVRSASLVAEPARYAWALRPEWIALEQVPSVLPLWKVYAAELGKLGYSTWCGKLNAADYGVPQTRERAILIASRVRKVSRPEPTHYDPRKGMQLWGTPWVSMTEALGWGATGRPGPAVTAGGTTTGGAEPFARGGRDALEAERDSGNWILHTNRDQRPDGSRQTADPRSAPALTAKSGGQWVLRTSYGQPSDTPGNGTHEMDPELRPSHAVTTKARSWMLRTGNNSELGDGSLKRYERGIDEPAPTFAAGDGSKWTLAGEGPDSVRITPQEAAILQTFPADYPWQGTKTKQFEQIGNAVPPLLAAHVVAMAAGLRLEAIAA